MVLEAQGSIKRFSVILVRPEKAENIGLVARNMKNTGFENLRLVKLSSLESKSYLTAVHAKDVLEKARFYPFIAEATRDLDIIFAASSKKRRNFSSLSLNEAVAEVQNFPLSTKIGLLFGNERTGLTSKELRYSNFRYVIPQSSKQPSYNLASAVLLTLFQIFKIDFNKKEPKREQPLSREKQEECIQLILSKLEKKEFIHTTNKEHVTQLIYDLLGRLAITERDKKLLLAIFNKT